MFDVYLYEARVGTLAPRGRGMRFTYTQQALENERLPAVSVSLPKRVDPFSDSLAGPFFRNLLPEQAFRRIVSHSSVRSAANAREPCRSGRKNPARRRSPNTSPSTPMGWSHCFR